MNKKGHRHPSSALPSALMVVFVQSFWRSMYPIIVSSNTASSSWASSKVEPDNTAFLNTAPWRLAFPKFTRSRTAFEKSTPANSLKSVHDPAETWLGHVCFLICHLNSSEFIWNLTKLKQKGLSTRLNIFRIYSEKENQCFLEQIWGVFQPSYRVFEKLYKTWRILWEILRCILIHNTFRKYKSRVYFIILEVLDRILFLRIT